MSEAYLIRVEMHGARASDYDDFHVRMRSFGYLRDIRGDDGRFYRLPTAMYHQAFSVNVTSVSVRQHVASIAKDHGWPAADVLVIHYKDAAWNMPEAEHSRAA